MTNDQGGFCVLPWISVQINQDGAVLPCCRTDEKYLYGDVSREPLSRSWNSEKMKALRVAMMNGEKPDVCRECHSVEAAGGFSHRQDFNEKFPEAVDRVARTRADGHLDETSLLHLGIRFSNVCNLKCRTCTPRNSTSWRTDAKALGEWIPEKVKITPRSNSSEYLAELEPHIATLKEVYFAGGEPLLDEAHYLFLEKLLAAGRRDVRLVYNTNFTTLELGRWNVLELWKEFDDVMIGASLDAVGSQASLIRNGTDWPEIVRNFLRVRMLANVDFSIHCTVSVLNAFHLPTAIDEWLARGMIANTNVLFFNIVREPDHYSIDVLNDVERAHLRENYVRYWKTLDGRVAPAIAEDIGSRMAMILASFSRAASAEKRAHFSMLSGRLDVLRGESLSALAPELTDLLG